MSVRTKQLTVHAIVMIVLGAAAVVLGGWDIVATSLKRAARNPMSAARGPGMGVNTVTGTARATGNAFATPPRSIRDVTRYGYAGKNAWAVAKRYLAYGWIVIAGVAAIAMGVLLLRGKDWARIGSFAAAGALLLWFAAWMGTAMTKPAVGMVLPVLVLAVAAVAAAKLLWDVMQAPDAAV